MSLNIMIMFLLTFFIYGLILGMVFASNPEQEALPSHWVSILIKDLEKIKDLQRCQEIKVNSGQKTESFTNYYIMDQEELEMVRCFNKNAFETIFHPANYKSLYADYGDSSLDLPTHLKSKLYPGYDPELRMSRYGVKIPEGWQKKIWFDLNLNIICDILVKDSDSRREGVGVLNVIKEKQGIRNQLRDLIANYWLDWETVAFSNHLKSLGHFRRFPVETNTNWINENNLWMQINRYDIFLRPQYEQFLVGSYQGGEQRLANHILFQLYPNGFFPLREVNVPEEAQREILKLLGLKCIFWIIDNLGYAKNYYNVIGDLLQKEEIVNGLRDTVVATYWKELRAILIKVPEPIRLPKNIPWKKDEYEELCKFISKKIIPSRIVYRELEKVTSDWTYVFAIYPSNFFPLNGTNLVINQRLQQMIFGLLFTDKHMLAQSLAKLGCLHPQSKNRDIKEFIKQEKVITKLRDMVVSEYWEKLVEILVRISNLEWLSKGKGHKWCGNSYQSLCDAILNEYIVVTVYKELEETLSNKMATGMECPIGFFPLDGTGLKVRQGLQEEIFKVLTEDRYEFARWLVKLGYHKQTECDINSFIKKEEIMTRLRDIVVSHYRWEEPWSSMVKENITKLRLLYMSKMGDSPKDAYQILCNFLAKVVLESTIYNELERISNYGEIEIPKICPFNFFPLENTGIELNQRRQRNLFKLLFRDKYKLTKLLVKLGYDKEIDEIGHFIKKEETVTQLRNMVLREYWKDLVKILSKVLGLKGLKQLLQDINDDYTWSENPYSKVCMLVSEEIIPRYATYKELEEATGRWKEIIKLCPSSFFSLGRTGVTVDLVIQQEIFKLLLEDRYGLAWLLFKLGYRQERQVTTIHDFIRQEKIMTKLCDTIVRNYWRKLVRILINVPGLEALPQDRYWPNYDSLCDFIIALKDLVDITNKLETIFKELNLDYQPNK